MKINLFVFFITSLIVFVAGLLLFDNPTDLLLIFIGMITGVSTGYVSSLKAGSVLDENNRNQEIVVNAMKLRNCLCFIYNELDCIKKNISSNLPILYYPTLALDRHQWFDWKTQVRDVQSCFMALYRGSMAKALLVLFEMPCDYIVAGATVKSHYVSIRSVILKYHPDTSNLGLIEFTTESLALIQKAESKYLELVSRSQQFRDFYDEQEEIGCVLEYKPEIDWLEATNKNRPPGGMRGINDMFAELMLIREEIYRHYKHLENLLPKGLNTLKYINNFQVEMALRPESGN